MPQHIRFEQFDCTTCGTHVDMRKPNATACTIDGDWNKPICEACYRRAEATWLASERSANLDMAIRERFAMAAMQGLLACPEAASPNEGESIPALYGRLSVEYADALIAELAKAKP